MWPWNHIYSRRMHTPDLVCSDANGKRREEWKCLNWKFILHGLSFQSRGRFLERMRFIDKHDHYGTSVICKFKCVLVRLKHSGHELESRSELECVSAFYSVVFGMFWRMKIICKPQTSQSKCTCRHIYRTTWKFCSPGYEPSVFLVSQGFFSIYESQLAFHGLLSV